MSTLQCDECSLLELGNRFLDEGGHGRPMSPMSMQALETKIQQLTIFMRAISK